MPRETPDKAATAFRTIGEVSRETGLPQHILRYWETRFVQLRPVQRAGNRRYYRPEDTALVRRIDQLLNRDGYTVRGVQQLLAVETPRRGTASGGLVADEAVRTAEPRASAAAIVAIRDSLVAGLAEDTAPGRR